MRLFLALACSCLAADLKAPRTAPEHYPVQSNAGGVTIAAEYLLRSIPGERETFFARDHLVVEVALFPPKGARLEVAPAQFTLRLNGKISKAAESPQMVAASLKYDDWNMRPRVEAGGSVGDASVIVGGPRRDPRFPGDPTNRPPPPAPRVETGVDRSGQERPRELAHETAVALALPQAALAGPERGYLYFAYDGKTKSLKKVELIYRGPEGEAVLQLK